MSRAVVRVVIADDEPLARETLRVLLSDVDWIAEIREVGDGATAASLIDAWEPDLAFLDVVMPGLSGLDVLTKIRHKPRVVFTTAHDQFAIAAFELGALDYVLKPFGPERVLRVLARVREALAADELTSVDRARAVLEPAQLSRVFVRDGNRILNVDLSTVESISGGDDHAVFCVGTREHLVSVRLQDLAQRLDASRFVRIHRSHIINLDFVVLCEPYDAWRLQAVMKSGRRLVASRAGTRLLKGLVLG